MHKLMLTAAALAALSPVVSMAHASDRITVKIFYDAEKLATDDGAADVLTGIQADAKNACTARDRITRMPKTDAACTDDIVQKAVTQIVMKQSAAGLETAPGFAALARIEMADLQQR